MKSEKERKHEEVKQIKRALINFAQTTWGREWIHSILKIGRPYRMRRGIEYAKDKERIDNLIINKGMLFATVQGTAPSPYRVKVEFDLIPDEGWKEIIHNLSKKASNVINLLEGELPLEILNIFKKANYPLFIDAEQGLKATCSCPDKAVPCKHIAATILYIARVLDFNPFILLKLRGRSKEDLLNELRLSKKIEIKELKKTKDEIESFPNIPKLSIREIDLEQSFGEEISKIGFKFKKPGKIIETLENLGLPKNLPNPKAFATVLNSIYHTVAKDIYNSAVQLEKSQKKR